MIKVHKYIYYKAEVLDSFVLQVKDEIDRNSQPRVFPHFSKSKKLTQLIISITFLVVFTLKQRIYGITLSKGNKFRFFQESKLVKCYC